MAVGTISMGKIMCGTWMMVDVRRTYLVGAMLHF